MREAMIICPKAGNDGRSLWTHIARVEERLVDAFGGCTRTAAVGRWRSPEGALMVEDVYQVVTAYEPSAKHDATLERIAAEFCRDAEQQAVYVRYANGDVAINGLGAIVMAA